jgi:hypothetical protein
LPSLAVGLNALATENTFHWLLPKSKSFYVSSFQAYILDPAKVLGMKSFKGF